MTTEVEFQWTNLPDHIIVHIFSYLNFNQRCKCAQVCKTWLTCFNQPLLWKKFTFYFIKSEDKQYLNLATLHGHHMKHVSIILDQHEKENREKACEVINIFSSIEDQKVSSLSLKFVGENPLFYAGLEFIDTLKIFFAANHQNGKTGYLTEVDLSGLWIDLNEEVLDILATNHKNLQKLNIQNRSLISKISPACLVRVLHQCVQLSELSLFYVTLSDEVLETFAEEGRSSPLKYLSIKCRRQEKFVKILSDNLWKNLHKNSPNLKVTMIFDHNCLLEKVSSILSPSLPVSELLLETFTMLFDEINLAASYYRNTLERLVVQTRPSRELEEALINVTTKCHKLKSLIVYCVLSEETVDKIHALCPRLKEERNYILKTVMDPEPWIVGVEEGD
ncbi:hypothetical protein LOTGIDRAFT_236076 [Lottia gigantea]|uniref:F-box domain-containing protein n=1 Tax=Lottia gigantea TaxID=225164 RepID=V4B862_LOTGI|nr:hypothetical protein LOTGIDRAFT_236076 [Lottia gigantea]ESO84864.1 hypothetical protein LOTGIDRAFT_236076 [Lottia gigantea]